MFQRCFNVISTLLQCFYDIHVFDTTPFWGTIPHPFPSSPSLGLLLLQSLCPPLPSLLSLVRVTINEGAVGCDTVVVRLSHTAGRTAIRVIIGLVNAGSTYNRMVRKLLDGATNPQSYVDDVIGHTKNWDEHIQTLRGFFERVKQGRLSLKPSKCKIGFGTVNFLGHTLNSNFIGPLQETIGRILGMHRPTAKKQVRSLLGLISFYRRYM